MIKSALAIALVIALTATVALAEDLGSVGELSPDLEAVTQVRNYYVDWLSSFPGVTDVGVGKNEKGQPSILVTLTEVTPQAKQIPHELNGFPVIINSQSGRPVPANEDDATEAAATAQPDADEETQPNPAGAAAAAGGGGAAGGASSSAPSAPLCSF